MTSALFEGTANSQAVLLALASTIFLAWLAAFVAGRLARRALQTVLGDHLSISSPLVRGPLRLVSVATFVLCVSLMLVPAFELAGLKPRVEPLALVRLCLFCAHHRGVRYLRCYLAGPHAEVPPHDHYLLELHWCSAIV